MFLMNKKYLLAVSALIISLSLSACSGDEGEADSISKKISEATSETGSGNESQGDAGGAEGYETAPEANGEGGTHEGSKDGTNKDSYEGNADYSQYAGEYEDSFSQRATMEAEDLGDSLKLTVHWSSTARESSIWTMTARFTAKDKLSYTDCESGTIVFDDDGNDTYTKDYDSGKGYFTIAGGKLLWDGAADESCRDCVFESMDFQPSENGNEVRYLDESLDIKNLPDGKYPVKLYFDKMQRNDDSLSLDFMIYTVIRYAPDDIDNMSQGDIIYEYVDETTVNNYLIDTINYPVDEVCVINGGSERGEGLTLSKDDSGYWRVSVAEGYTRNSPHGIVTMDIPDTVTFEDNHALADARLKGSELYDYFNGLNSDEKEYFNANNTFMTVSGGKITGLSRIYLP